MTWQPDLWSYNPRDARRSVRETNVAEADEAEQRNSKPSQRDQILKWFVEHPYETLTHLKAQSLFGCSRLAARVRELRAMGHRIDSRMVETPSGKRVAEYWL